MARPVLLLWFALLLMAAPPIRAQESDAEEIVVLAEGLAALGADVVAAQEEAVWDAKRNAVEQAVGVFLRARSVGRDFELEEDEIQSRTNGFVRRWELVPDSRTIEPAGTGGGRLLKIKIRATIALLPIIQRLSDIKDVYNDLERPRVQVRIEHTAGQSAAAALTRHALVAALQAQGFDIAHSGPAEVLVLGALTVVPTLKLGDRNSPFGIGETVAAGKARLSVQVISAASEETLLTVRSEGAGQSFQSDAEAATEAATDAVTRLLRQSEPLFVQRLLVRWARERQEGHQVVVKAVGLNARQRATLRARLASLRGFRRFTAVHEDKETLTLRFLTRLDTRAIRRRLAELRFENQARLTVTSPRGPIIDCKLAGVLTRRSGRE